MSNNSVFKRLAFFAAANSDLIAPDQAVDWLLADEGKWLWALETQKEIIRLLANLSPKLDKKLMNKIEDAILKGPVEKTSARSFDHQIWFRLAKMQKYRAPISNTAKSKINELENIHKFELAEDDSDEVIISTSKISHEWIDNRIKDLTSSIKKLYDLSKNDEWLVKDWDEVLRNLHNLEDNKSIRESWNQLAPVIINMPKDYIKEISHSLSLWLEKVSKIFEEYEDIFFRLIDSILNLKYADDEFYSSEDDLVVNAINHPTGYVTQALLHWWYRQKPKNSEGLHEKVEPVFTELCNWRKEKFRHGRLLLAVNTNSLFLTDKKWTKDYLLPFFSWQSSEEEACAAWQGFSWRNQLLRPCLLLIKKDFLETTKHYEKLSEYKRAFINILTLAAVDREDTFTYKELQDAISDLPEEGLQESLWSLIQILESAGGQREECWRNRILPYLRDIWPQTIEIKTRDVSIYMTDLCITTGEAFPEAVEELYNWLQQHDSPDNILHSLVETGLCKKFPDSSLKFLDAIISDDLKPWLLSYLKECLDNIEISEPSLAADRRFIRLKRIFSR